MVKATKPTTHSKLLDTFVEVLHDTYGVVFEIEHDEVYAHIYSHDGEFLENIVFDQCELPEEDVKLLSLGSVFYWVVGCQMVGAEKVDASEMRIRRLPLMGSPKENEAYQKARKHFQDVLCSS